MSRQHQTPRKLYRERAKAAAWAAKLAVKKAARELKREGQPCAT
jgi:hypothetical protein